MKFFAIYILLFCGVASAEVRISNGKMTVNIVNRPLDEVLSILREKTDIRFYVDEAVIDESICADFQNFSVARGIKKLLEGTGINYAVIGNKGETQAIFIGSSQKPQPSSAKLPPRSTTLWRKQTTYQPAGFQRVQPAKNKLIESKKKQPADRIELPISIPTTGNLGTVAAPKTKQHED